MPSGAPTPSNDYKWDPAPSRAKLTRLIWDTVFGSTDPNALGVGPRLRALEDVNTGIETIQAELEQFGLERLNEAIEPLITDTQATVAALTEQVATLEEQFEDIVSGAVPAAIVTESATRVFVTPAQKTAIGTQGSAITALSGHVDDVNTALTAAVNARVVMQIWEVKAANFTAVSGHTYVCDGGVAVTFPTTVNDGDCIGIVTETSAETTEVTVIFSGKTFDGATTNASIKIAVSLMFEYHNGAWRLAP